VTEVSLTVQLVTPEEAAKLLRVATVTIYSWIRRGRLPAYQLGRAKRLALSDLEAFVKSHRVGGRMTAFNADPAGKGAANASS